MITSQEIAQAFITLSTEADDIDRCAEVCLQFLHDNHLEHMLSSVVSHMERLTATDESFNVLQFVTAFTEDSESLSKEVIKKLDIKPQDTSIKHDKNLIGGFIAEYQGIRYDASIRNQLEQLQTTLTHS